MALSILAELESGLTTTSAEESRAIAARLAAVLPPGAVLALHGDLGAGKTTFVQGLAIGLGIQEPITSPTFNIFTLHRGADRSADRTLIHVDAYRLKSGTQLEDLMIDDFLLPPWWVAIEWPGHVADWLPPATLHLELGHRSVGTERHHTIHLRPRGHCA